MSTGFSPMGRFQLCVRACARGGAAALNGSLYFNRVLSYEIFARQNTARTIPIGMGIHSYRQSHTIFLHVVFAECTQVFSQNILNSMFIHTINQACLRPCTGEGAFFHT